MVRCASMDDDGEASARALAEAQFADDLPYWHRCFAVAQARWRLGKYRTAEPTPGDVLMHVDFEPRVAELVAEHGVDGQEMVEALHWEAYEELHRWLKEAP